MATETLSTVEMNAIERMVLDGEKGDRKTVVLKPRTARRLLDMLAGTERGARILELEQEVEQREQEIERLGDQIIELRNGEKELQEAV